jgi:ribose 5-phosphate isomerase A
MSQDLEKVHAAQAAAKLVKDGMLLGLGSGSTSLLAVKEIGARIIAEGLKIEAVSTSVQTMELARSLGIPLFDPPELHLPDLYIDGADQIDDNGVMIKGGGGALLREKIIARASKFHAIIVDSSKPVKVLGKGFPLPVDINRFGWQLTLEAIKAAAPDCTPALREKDDELFQTNDGNYVVDCDFPNGISDAKALEAALLAIPGIMETGLFFNLCDQLIIGTADGTDVRTF